MYPYPSHSAEFQSTTAQVITSSAPTHRVLHRVAIGAIGRVLGRRRAVMAARRWGASPSRPEMGNILGSRGR